MLELYGSVGIFAGIVQAVYLAMAFGLGGTLLLRGHRTRDWAQRLVGAHLLLALGLGYLLLSAGVASVELGIEIAPSLLAQLIGWGYGATILGLIATLLFTRRVFRPESPWASALVVVAALVMATGFAGYGLTGGFSRGRFEGAWLWLMLAGMLLTNGWVAAEPLLYWSRLRRRLRLGLAEPVVTDRFLFWGCGSLSRGLMVLIGPVAAELLHHTAADAQLAIGGGVLVLASLCGLITSGAYWLTFRPPELYTRWTRARAARLAS